MVINIRIFNHVKMDELECCRNAYLLNEIIDEGVWNGSYPTYESSPERNNNLLDSLSTEKLGKSAYRDIHQ